MGKQSAPATPDYSAIVAADTHAADLQFKTSQDQLAWAKQQYNNVAPDALNYMRAMTSNQEQQTKNAQNLEKQYTSVTQPEMTSFAKTADNWNSTARADQQAGMAVADVANSMNTARQNAQAQLESYGIDPSQTRFSALTLGSNVQQAAAEAGAGTQSRVNTEMQGLQLKGQSINMGQGLPNQVATAYGGASNSGASGINSANQTYGTGSTAMGNPTAWGGLGYAGTGGATNALNTGYNNSLAGAQFQANQSVQFASGLGNLIGGAGGLAMMKYG